MKTAVISFTQNGNACNRRIITGLRMAGYTTEGFYGGRYKENDSLAKEILRPAAKKVAEWTKDAFEKYDAIVFVGAAAIAVRSIAPCLKDKLTDPAVLVVDETFRSCGRSQCTGSPAGSVFAGNTCYHNCDRYSGFVCRRCVCSEESFADNGSKKSKRDICFDP